MIKLLVVDDELDVCDFTKSFFEKRGFEVFCAGGGEEAISITKAENPQIALLDIRMEEMDGITLLGHIKKINPSIIAIMVTAVDDMKKMEQARALGAKDYITKPLVLEELEKKVLRIASELKKG